MLRERSVRLDLQPHDLTRDRNPTRRIDDFAYVGGFSSAPLGQSYFGSVFPGITTQSAPGINARLRLLWIACATEDGLLDRNQKLIAWLKEKGLQPAAIQIPGMQVWMVWRDNLTNFAVLLQALVCGGVIALPSRAHRR
jgi:hypothetical protein